MGIRVGLLYRSQCMEGETFSLSPCVPGLGVIEYSIGSRDNVAAETIQVDAPSRSRGKCDGSGKPVATLPRTQLGDGDFSQRSRRMT